MDPEQQELARNRIPLKRFGTPDEVADAVLFLIRNEYANNCVLNLDGGVSAALV
jgi:NAD(P)-dependent dehydrogenase (short-subunit alcohol dehydrogenase family)